MIFPVAWAYEQWFASKAFDQTHAINSFCSLGGNSYLIHNRFSGAEMAAYSDCLQKRSMP